MLLNREIGIGGITDIGICFTGGHHLQCFARAGGRKQRYFGIVFQQ